MKTDAELMEIHLRMDDARVKGGSARQIATRWHKIIGDLTREDIGRLKQLSEKVMELYRQSTKAMRTIAQHLGEHQREMGKNVTVKRLLEHHIAAGNESKHRILSSLMDQHEAAEQGLRDLGIPESRIGPWRKPR